MSIFRRLSATVISGVDQMVGQIENHDAVIEAAIRDARRASAKAKVRLAHMRKESDRMKHRVEEARREEAQWVKRARSVGTSDENAAIECLRRRRECQRQVTQLEQAIVQQAGLQERLARDIRMAEDRVDEMAQQRNLMRTRQSAADALTAVANIDESVTADLSSVFERWEVNVTEAEMEAGTIDSVDHLEQGFLDEEQRDELRDELRELMTQKERNDDN